MSDHPQHPSVRRIVLPSGRSIEVVRFPEGDEAPQRELHVCTQCASELVQPVAWSDVAGGRWELTLECPNCRSVELGIYDRERVEQLEEVLNEGLAEMLDDLRRLTQVNMCEEMDRFAAALQADLILPEDF